MRLTHSLLAAALGLSLLAGCASYGGKTAQVPVQVAGGALTNPAGMTLYVFDKDPADASKSACNGDCAVKWPPLMAGAGDKAVGDYSIVTRDDGSKQWAYKGKPLYLWIKDQKPGDMTGDGVNNVWHTAKP
ncbi:MAG: hypothetical protein HXY26_04655 [Hydrogenophilaceae bacterium]|nr:hypothetical protein [Hydrogenophilaceae bacterium]